MSAQRRAWLITTRLSYVCCMIPLLRNVRACQREIFSIVNILIAVVLTLYHILLLGEVFASKLTKRRIFDVTQTWAVFSVALLKEWMSYCATQSHTSVKTVSAAVALCADVPLLGQWTSVAAKSDIVNSSEIYVFSTKSGWTSNFEYYVSTW